MSATNLFAELFYSGVWHDITADLYTRDPAQITRVRPDEVSRTPPSTMTLSIKNQDGRYSPRNPMSPLYGLIGRNTGIRAGVGLAEDAFTRSVSNGWGTADSGQVWSTAGGAASDYSVDGTRGEVSHGTVSVNRRTILDRTARNVALIAELRPEHVATGNNIEMGLIARRVDGSNEYFASVLFGLAGAATFRVQKTVGGATTTITTMTPSWSGSYTSTSTAILRFEIQGPVLRGKVWLSTSVEPVAWDIEVIDTAITVAGKVGTRSSLQVGNTNTSPVVIHYDNFTVRSYRCTGEVESWPQRWNVTGSDVWAPITANGIMRRLNAPGTTAPALSALRRAITRSAPSAYWPMEDGPDATQAASAVGGQPMSKIGTVAFLTSALLAGSTGCADMSGGGQLGGSTGVAAGTATTWEAEACFGWETLPAAGGADTYFLIGWDTPGSSIIQWGIVLDDSGPDLFLGVYYFDGTTTNIGFNTATPIQAGRVYHFRMRLIQVGGSVEYYRYLDGVPQSNGVQAGVTLTAPTYANVNPRAQSVGQPTYLSHVATWLPTRAAALTYQAAPAYTGETAADRITRLCAEEGIAVKIIGDAAASERVGVQRPLPVLDLLFDAAEADDGILYEPRDTLGFAYRVHADLYNQAPALSVDYAAGGEVAPPLFPVEDTDATANDVTVTRYQGSSSTLVRETGPLNVQEPPAGVGRYGKEHTLVLHQDAQTFQQAAWKRHLGTWDEARFPVVNLDLTAMEVDGKTALAQAAADLDAGDRFVITSPPPWLPPDPIEQHAQGFTEIIESHRRTIAVNATPAGPYNVATLDSVTLGRLGNDACTLNEALDTTETGVDVISVNTPWGSQFPYDINIGGEKMTVTARSGAGLTQTLTVTRSVNGVVKTHASGAPVRLWTPARLAR